MDGEEGADDDDDDEESKDPAKKKKKKRSKFSHIIVLDKKKKKAGEGADCSLFAPRAQDNSHFRLLGDWKAEGKTPYRQTYPPTIPISQQFIDGKYPEGEICEYAGDFNRKRITAAEYREKERLFTTDYEALRKAAECHR